MNRALLCSLLALAACGKKSDDAPAADKNPPASKPSAASAAGPKSDSPFAEFGTTEEILKKWQGAWMLEAGSLGHFEAWHVEGNKLTTSDGTKEDTLELVIESPCSGKVVKKENGGSSSTGVTFVFEGDTLHSGMGDAGLKKGDKIIACGSGRVFVWDGKDCKAYSNDFGGRWKSEPTTCSLDGTTFTATRPGPGEMKSTLVVAGDILMSEQMKRNKVEKATDLADAKAKLAARKK